MSDEAANYASFEPEPPRRRRRSSPLGVILAFALVIGFFYLLGSSKTSPGTAHAADATAATLSPDPRAQIYQWGANGGTGALMTIARDAYGELQPLAAQDIEGAAEGCQGLERDVAAVQALPPIADSVLENDLTRALDSYADMARDCSGWTTSGPPGYGQLAELHPFLEDEQAGSSWMNELNERMNEINAGTVTPTG